LKIEIAMTVRKKLTTPPQADGVLKEFNQNDRAESTFHNFRHSRHSEFKAFAVPIFPFNNFHAHICVRSQPLLMGCFLIENSWLPWSDQAKNQAKILPAL